MGRKPTVTGANKIFFAYSVFYIIFQIILTIASILFGENFIKNSLYEILLVNQYVIILAPVAVYIFAKGLDPKEVFRLNRLEILPAAIIFLLFIPAQFAGNMLNTLVIYLLQFAGNIPANPIPVPGNLSELAQGIFVIAASPAICEELMHRGLMLSAYERRGTIKAVAVTSIFFGIFHFDITNLLGATFLGFLIGYYVVRTNSIFAGMLAHFLNNAFYEFMMFFARNEAAEEKIIKITGEELERSLLYGIAGLLAVGLLLMLFRRATDGKYAMKPPVSSV
ncbi:MAG: CPBP family intramembrane metalloprotease, partial [Oscillospiraceae bacterium]|nr:CPBP family intramembrane metalloprotease [Oscillospiraceae bacterium]